jgi:hypothetical protein
MESLLRTALPNACMFAFWCLNLWDLFMIVERNLIIAILALTKDGPTSHELINKQAKIPSEDARKLLRKMQEDGLVYVRKDTIELEGVQRLKLAVRALSLGGDIEQIASFLTWQEFEEMAGLALGQNGYSVRRNLRFKHAGRKWEIDVVGCRKPLAICIDCKHWHHSLRPSVIKEVVEEQIERTKALAEALPNPTIRIECTKWEKAKFIPVVLSLMQGATKFHDEVPVVSVLQLQDFVNKLPAYSHRIYQITKTREESLSLGHDF